MRRIRHLLVSFFLFACALVTVDRDYVTYAANRIAGRDCPDTLRKELEATVQDYNKILADFYASGGRPAMLNAMPATKQMRHEIFRDIGYVTRVDKILVYDIATITPFEARLTGPGKAEVRFFEEWNYMYQNRDRSPNTRPMGFGRGIRYFLVKNGGTWQVDDWDPDPDVPDLSTKEFKF